MGPGLHIPTRNCRHKPDRSQGCARDVYRVVPHVDGLPLPEGCVGAASLSLKYMLPRLPSKCHSVQQKAPACTTATPKIHSCLLHAGYTNASGGFSSGLLTTLNYVDRSIGTIYQALITRGLTPSTAIIITAKHGQQVTSFGRMWHASLSQHHRLMLPGNKHQPGAAWRPAATSAPPMDSRQTSLLLNITCRSGVVVTRL